MIKATIPLLLVILSLIPLIGYADPSSENTQGGNTSLNSSEIVSESNQWKFDLPQGFLDLNLRRSSSLQRQIQVSHYMVNFDEDSTLSPELVGHYRFIESSQIFFFYNYSVGIFNKEGKLSDLNSQNQFSHQNSNFLGFPISIGLDLSWEVARLIYPTLSYSIGSIFYRLSSSLSTAEEQGSYEYHTFAIGLRVRPYPKSPFSIQGQMSNMRPLKSNEKFQDSSETSFGVGWVF